jgi:hypothetical protein
MANSGCKWRQRLVFWSSNWICGQTESDARYTALEPAYGSQWIEMLGGYPVQVDISGHGLRERGLGSCSSKISWSPPQCGHFNFLPAIA